MTGGRDLDVIRIVARRRLTPHGMGSVRCQVDRIRAEFVHVLKANVPDVKPRALTLRTRSVAGMSNWLVLAPVGAELRNRSEKQIERLLVPMVAGTFRGTS